MIVEIRGLDKVFDIGDNIDNDGEIIFDVEDIFNDKYLYSYINKEQAKQIVAHLTKVFEL